MKKIAQKCYKSNRKYLAGISANRSLKETEKNEKRMRKYLARKCSSSLQDCKVKEKPKINSKRKTYYFSGVLDSKINRRGEAALKGDRRRIGMLGILEKAAQGEKGAQRIFFIFCNIKNDGIFLKMTEIPSFFLKTEKK